jgi:tetratricopeptide (TPR) repeat protein/predicted nucleotidyltransferase
VGVIIINAVINYALSGKIVGTATQNNIPLWGQLYPGYLAPLLATPGKMASKLNSASNSSSKPASKGAPKLASNSPSSASSGRSAHSNTSASNSSETVPPPRVVDLHSYVTETEAEYFAHVVNSLHAESNLHIRQQIDMYCTAITAAAKLVLGEFTTSEVCGSVAKGTNVASSDIDMYIDTRNPVSLAQRKALTDSLRAHPLFHQHHVHLGKLAIHVCTICGDIDVVCSNTVEYGVRTRHDPTIVEDLTLIQAIRALKVWIKHGRADKVSGYKLEAMAKTIKTAYPIPIPFAGGGMQLFVSILQAMVDSGSGAKLFGLPGGTGAATDMFKLARLTLHLFVCSRALHGSLRDTNEVNGWIMCAIVEHEESEVGIVPQWMLSSDGRPPVNSAELCLFDRFKRTNSLCSESGSTSTAITLDRSQNALKLLRRCPIGAYTLNGMIETDAVNNEAMSLYMSKLKKFASVGSQVAARMIVTRKLWFQGMACFDNNDYSAALSLFGASLRHATFNSDPFSGIFSGTSKALDLYKNVCARTLVTDARNIDAALVLSMISVFTGSWQDAQSILQRSLHHATDDAYGVLYYYGITLGNRGRWEDALEYFERCVTLHPTEPIFYYWRATALRQIGYLGDNVKALRIIKDYDRFLQLAPPEGRKVSQAYYEKILVGLYVDFTSRIGPDRSALKKKYLKALAAAKASEMITLDIFPPLKCDAKPQVVALLSGFSETPVEDLRMQGNEAYKRKDFRRAAELYSAAIEQNPSAELYSNRSAANSALEYFSWAARDAREALLLRPNWSKAYFRLAVAHVGRKDFRAALDAATEALFLNPDDESVLNLKVDMEWKCFELGETAENDFEIQLSECWSHVMFKDRVVVIDPAGGWDYCTITDAFSDCIEKYENDFTLVLRPGVHHGCIGAANESLVDSLTFQLLGWNDASSTDKELRSELAVGKEHSSLINIDGKIQMHVQQVVFKCKISGAAGSSSHCIFCSGGSQAYVEHCFFRTSSNVACCAIRDPQTELNLRDCTFKSIWSAVLVTNDAVLNARHCTVIDSHKQGVEVRLSARAVLEDCTFVRCNSQAVILYNGGLQLQLTRCLVSHCGNKGACHSSILVETGTACLRDCTVKDCNADAVLLQQAVGRDEPPPVLLMEACRLERNHSGCSIHFGSGVISGNTIRCHVGLGLIIRHVPRGRKVFVRGNTIDRNGHNQDFIIQGETLFRESIVCDSCNTCSPSVMSDVLAKNLEALLRAQVDSLGCKT